MSGDTLHIVFTLSARASLSEALKLADRPDKVIGLGDDLSRGSILQTDTLTRGAIVEDLLGHDAEDDWFDIIDAFWPQALESTQERIVWFSQWSTMEYCGFLEWFSRNEGKPFKVVDLSHVRLPARNAPDTLLPVQCVSLVPEAAFSRHALWSLARSPTDEETQTWTTLWQGLKSENAPLRVITEDGLVSAPIDHFDKCLLKHVSKKPIKASRVIGGVLGDMMFESFREGGIYQCGDLLLFSRLRQLVEQGRLKAEGDIWGSGFLVYRP